MFCGKCGNAVVPGAAVCGNCGAPVVALPPGGPAPAAPTATPAPSVAAAPMGAAPVLAQAAPSTRNKKVVAIVVLAIVFGGAAAFVVMSGVLNPMGQCVLQETDFGGTTTTHRYESYTESECDAYCAAHPGHPCWFDAY